jgi:pimeloyl-ACP methyl ester carboxylesterase
MRGTYGHSCIPASRGRARFAVIALSLLSAGCSASGWHFQPEDRFGRTYYIDGAGNWGFGSLAVPHGLRDAGYQGRVAQCRWSITLNPALDQTLGRYAAKARGRRLAREIENYLGHYPDNQVHIIALSAGTGVAIWSCENLTPPAKVDNLVLLSSSLSSNYPMGKALGHIKGRVYVYVSPNDGMLSGPVRALGTIDGDLSAEPAGLVGLRYPSPQVRNISWCRRFEAFGWTGSHVSAVSEPFVRHVLARHIVLPDHTGTTDTESDATTDLAAMQ